MNRLERENEELTGKLKDAQKVDDPSLSARAFYVSSSEPKD